MMRALCLVAAALACALDAARAEPLGPLLLTPAERRQLEAQRRGDAPPSGSGSPAARADGAAPAAQRVDGSIVARNHGVAGWIDGKRVLHGERLGQFRVEVVERGVRFTRPPQPPLQAPVGSEVDLNERAVREPVAVKRASP
jgi:hypothetical protein